MEINTSEKSFAIIIFKALGIYSIILSLEVIAYRFPIIYSVESINDNYAIILQVFGNSLLLIVGGLAIWYLSPLLVNLIFKQRIPNEQKKVSSGDLYVIIFSAIGIFVIIDVIPDIVNTVLFYYQIKGLPNVDKGIIADRNSLLIAMILKLVLGLGLFFGSSKVAEFIRKKEGRT